jgi:hypothetical protein
VKIDQLMKREKFPQVFTSTLGDYFKSTNGWEGEIIWGDHGSDQDLNLLVNSRLNLIYPLSMAKENLMPLVVEYAYHRNPLRRFSHWLYINITLCSLLRSFFSPIKIHITKCSGLPANICILPGNHSIRVVNLDLNKCLVITKNNYSDRKLKNAISTRLAYPGLPGPKIIDFNILEGWYSEERILGLPVDRTKDKAKVNGALLAAKTFLLKMYQDTSTPENALTWMRLKYKEVDAAIDSLPGCYQESDIVSIKVTKFRLAALSKRILDPEYLVPITLTHGDFQDANLLVPSMSESRDVYIIDWEYAGKRCSHYDWFVYGLRSRSPKGLADRINFLLHSGSTARSKLDWYDFSNINLSELKMLIILFLVDEFLFRLDDTNLPNLNQIPLGFLAFVEEVGMIVDLDLK